MRIAFTHEFLLKAYFNKDVVQVPLTLAKKLECDWSYITRPTPHASEALAGSAVEFVGAAPDAANADHLKSGNEANVRFSKRFALQAGWRAAATADVYVSMFLNVRSLLGVLAYRSGRLVRRRPGFVYLKADVSHLGRSRLERRLASRPISRILFVVLDWLLAKTSDTVSIETEDGRKWLAGVYRNVSSKAIVVRNCSATSSQGVHALSPREETIVAVGRLGAYEKAVDVLLPAFREFSATHPTWRLLLVGEANQRFSGLIQGYRDLVDAGRIIHVGYVNRRDELLRIYRSSSIFVQPSRWESVSIALTEAVREGCLPMCTPVFCVDEVFGKYARQLTGPVDDPSGLARALARLVSQRDSWEDMRKYLMERTATWNWDDQLEPVASAIRKKLVGSRPVHAAARHGE